MKGKSAKEGKIDVAHGGVELLLFRKEEKMGGVVRLRMAPLYAFRGKEDAPH